MAHVHSDTCGCNHDSADPLAVTDDSTLYQFVQTSGVRCLNEEEEGSCQKVIKPYAERHSTEPCVVSDADEELLFIIPFTGAMTITSICVAGVGDSAPQEIRLFKNRDDLDFDIAGQLKPTQTVQLPASTDGALTADLDFPLRAAAFNNVETLGIYIPSNYGDEQTKVHYIGFKGSYKKISREVADVQYELVPQAAGSKLTSTNAAQMGM